MVSRPAVVVVTRAGAPLAEAIASRLGGEVLAGTAALTAAFRAGRPVIALCAAGIVIRTLAPHLGDKAHDPPVVAVAEDGSAAVPLLGGHHGALTFPEPVVILGSHHHRERDPLRRRPR